jgi:hypothetical protein
LKKFIPQERYRHLLKKILEQVPGFWIFNEEAERVLNKNIVPLPGPALTDNQGVVESAPQVDPVPDKPLLDDANASTDNQGELEFGPEVAPVPDASLLENANIVSQPNPAATDKQGELESAPEVAPVPDVPLLDDTKGTGDTTVEPVGDVLSVSDKNLLSCDVGAVEGHAILLQGEKDTHVEPIVRDTSGSD